MAEEFCDVSVLYGTLLFETLGHPVRKDDTRCGIGNALKKGRDSDDLKDSRGETGDVIVPVENVSDVHLILTQCGHTQPFPQQRTFQSVVISSKNCNWNCPF